jgi:D-arabinose 1-dehydrogenase-like Zn-dependent alcohol dehydrogenase
MRQAPVGVGLSEHHGGYSEYLLVPLERYLVKLDRLTPKEAAPLTDAALTPYRAIRKALPLLEADHHVLLIGVGGLGQDGLKLPRLLTGCPIICCRRFRRQTEAGPRTRAQTLPSMPVRPILPLKLGS